MRNPPAPPQCRRRPGRIVIAATALLIAVAGSPTVTRAAETMIDPHATDPAIAHAYGQARHYVWTASGTPTCRLVLFLGGSKSRPGFYERFSDLASTLGNNVVDLRYPNRFVASSCPAPQPATAAALGAQDRCFAAVRGGTLFGTGSRYGDPPKPDVGWPKTADVGIPDSVIGRLVSLLQHQGWTRYLTPGDGHSPYGLGPHAYPDWSKIIVAGHSQGAGHALFIAKRFKVPRAVLLSGPDDSPGGRPATWAAAVGRTPNDRIYALRSQQEGIFCAGCDIDWQAAGIHHRAVTTFTPHSCLGAICGDVNRHDSTAVDSAVALDSDRTPLLTPTWTSMLAP